MARLPQPGGDNGSWGDILNDYLMQSHKTDGTIKDNAVTANTLAPNSVTSEALASGAITSAVIADESITRQKLSPSLKTELSDKIDKSDADIAYSPAGALTQTVANGLYAPFGVPLASGYYYGGNYPSVGSGAPPGPHNYVTASVLVVGRSTTLVRIAINVITAGSVGGVIRLGIYNFTPSTMVTSLLVDAGTVDTSTIGTKELTINQAVTAGQVLLLAGALQGNPTTIPVINRGGGQSPFVASSNLSIAAGNGLPAFGKTGITGAFPQTLGSMSGDGGAVRVVVRA